VIEPVSAVYPHMVYACQDMAPGLGLPGCAVSTTGGVGFVHSAPVTCGFVNPGSLGHLRVGPDGYAYIPINGCNGGQGVSVSGTNGLNWSGAAITGAKTGS